MPRTAAAAGRWQRLPDERPRALMASALKLVKRDGYRRVRLEDVAADAGVSKATIYHYFAGKDDLLTHSVAARMAERHAEIEQQIASAPGSAADRLTLLLEQLWRKWVTPQAGLWQRLLVSEIVNEAPDVFDAWARALVQRWKIVQRLIEDGQRTGEFRRDADAAVAARMIMSALWHQALFQIHFGMRRLAPCPAERIVRSILDVFLEGLRHRRRPSRS